MNPQSGLARVLAAAAALEVPVEVVRHGPVSSLAEAARARGVAPTRLVKTLVVRRAEGDHVLVLVPGDREIAWPLLRSVLGVNRASMPSPAEALAVTGYERGTITPLGTLSALPVVADARVSGRISLGAGEPGVALTVDAAPLLRALDAVVADVTAPSGG